MDYNDCVGFYSFHSVEIRISKQFIRLSGVAFVCDLNILVIILFLNLNIIIGKQNLCIEVISYYAQVARISVCESPICNPISSTCKIKG